MGKNSLENSMSMKILCVCLCVCTHRKGSGVPLQDGKVGGLWIHLFAWAHWIYSYIWNSCLKKKKKPKLAQWLLHVRWTRKNPHWSPWERLRHSLAINPTPVAATHNWEGTETLSFSLRNKGFEPHICHPSFYDLHLRDELLKHLALKANGACVHKTHRL